MSRSAAVWMQPFIYLRMDRLQFVVLICMWTGRTRATLYEFRNQSEDISRARLDLSLRNFPLTRIYLRDAFSRWNILCNRSRKEELPIRRGCGPDKNHHTIAIKTFYEFEAEALERLTFSEFRFRMRKPSPPNQNRILVRRQDTIFLANYDGGSRLCSLTWSPETVEADI